jgi:hypothetical protein
VDDRLVIALLVIGVAAIGLVALLASKRRVADHQDLVQEFGRKFADFTRSEGGDIEAYTWLTMNSPRMQVAMGSHGIYAAFRPPFANYQYRDYPIILNLLPELRRALADPILSRSLAEQYHSAISEALLRYAGSLEQRTENVHSELRNPVIWLREGVRWIVALPLTMLSWVGLLSPGRARAISYGGVFRVVSAIVTLVGFVSAVMGIVLGWSQFKSWLTGLLGVL